MMSFKKKYTEVNLSTVVKFVAFKTKDSSIKIVDMLIIFKENDIYLKHRLKKTSHDKKKSR